MATIGTFTSNGNGFTGSIRTLTLNVKAKLTRVENPSEKGPHFRIFAGTVELGAAYRRSSALRPCCSLRTMRSRAAKSASSLTGSAVMPEKLFSNSWRISRSVGNRTSCTGRLWLAR